MTMKYFPAGISKQITSPPRESAFRPIFKRGLTKLAVNNNFTSNWFCFAIADHSNLFTGRNRPASFLQTHVPFPHLTVTTLIYLTRISPCLALVAAAHVFPRCGTVVRLQVFPGMEPIPSFFIARTSVFAFIN